MLMDIVLLILLKYNEAADLFNFKIVLELIYLKALEQILKLKF